jgi:hypothetical protein
MKIYELMALSAPLLRTFANSGVKMEDVKYLPLMLRYEELKDNTKKVAIVKILSEEFEVSERHTYDIIAKLEKEC